jgi:RimJ/RimL family protein N-acetyltransferase
MSGESWKLSHMGAERVAQGAADVFSPVVTAFWHATFSGEDVVPRDAAFTVAVNADLSEDRRVMVLHTTDGAVRAVLTPSLADAAGLCELRPRSEADLRRALSEAGVALHAADNLFYFSRADLDTLLGEDPHSGVRQLSDADAALFARFQSSASEQDLDDAYVELDHWAVFGAFAQDRLVTAASMYPWGNARIADLGVLTLPAYRRRGHARAAVRALCKHAAQKGYEPQYRCQSDNHASLAVAKAAGLTHFGTWEVVSPDSPGD